MYYSHCGREHAKKQHDRGLEPRHGRSLSATMTLVAGPLQLRWHVSDENARHMP